VAFGFTCPDISRTYKIVIECLEVIYDRGERFPWRRPTGCRARRRFRDGKLLTAPGATAAMRRRTLLAALAGAVGVSGCSAGGDRPGTPTATAAPVPTGTPVAESLAPVAAAPCDGPSFGPATRRVVCTGVAGRRSRPVLEEGPAAPPVVLRRSAARLDLPARFSFALVNRSDVPFVTARSAWRLWKASEGEWFALSPPDGGEPGPLAPGTEHRWRLSLGPRLPSGPVRSVGRRGEVAVPALGAGRYAFTVDGWFPGEGPDRRTVFQATFDLGGEPLALDPSDRLVDVSVADGVARGRLRTGCRTCPEARYVLEHAPDETPDRRVIPETAVRAEPLRDALALAVEHGVDRVELSGRSPGSPPFGVGDGGYAFEYLATGRVYRVGARVP
jgi:hypothetical protein